MRTLPAWILLRWPTDASLNLSALDSSTSALKPLIAEGYVVVEGSVLRVPQNARAAVRLVASVFDSYLSGSKAVHAVAV